MIMRRMSALDHALSLYLAVDEVISEQPRKYARAQSQRSGVLTTDTAVGGDTT